MLACMHVRKGVRMYVCMYVRMPLHFNPEDITWETLIAPKPVNTPLSRASTPPMHN